MMKRLLLTFLVTMSLCQTAALAATSKPTVDVDRCEKPKWPLPELTAGHTGRVTLSFLVDENGAIQESKVKESSGYPALDLAAQEGLERCKFTAGTNDDGRAVAMWADMQYVWSIEEDEAVDDKAKLLKLLAAADSGDPRSQYELGKLYRAGTGVRADQELGLQWVQRAAEQGWPEAQTMMGMLAVTKGEAPNNPAAMVWFKKSAAQGDPFALYVVAMDLIEQEKVDESIAMLTESANLDFAPAVAMLGKILLESEDTSEHKLGIEMLERAAAQHFIPAQVLLANYYVEGKHLARDYNKAALLFSEAASNGSRDAKIALAHLYENGLGVLKNPARARLLIEQAGADD